jgi:hypothetical protein
MVDTAAVLRDKSCRMRQWTGTIPSSKRGFVARQSANTVLPPLQLRHGQAVPSGGVSVASLTLSSVPVHCPQSAAYRDVLFRPARRAAVMSLDMGVSGHRGCNDPQPLDARLRTGTVPAWPSIAWRLVVSLFVSTCAGR